MDVGKGRVLPRENELFEEAFPQRSRACTDEDEREGLPVTAWIFRTVVPVLLSILMK